MAAPTIPRQPEPCTVEPGGTARFEVGAEGDGLSFQWNGGPPTSPAPTVGPISWSLSPATTGPSSASSCRTPTGPGLASMPGS